MGAAQTLPGPETETCIPANVPILWDRVRIVSPGEILFDQVRTGTLRAPGNVERFAGGLRPMRGTPLPRTEEESGSVLLRFPQTESIIHETETRPNSYP